MQQQLYDHVKKGHSVERNHQGVCGTKIGSAIYKEVDDKPLKDDLEYKEIDDKPFKDYLQYKKIDNKPLKYDLEYKEFDKKPLKDDLKYKKIDDKPLKDDLEFKEVVSDNGSKDITEKSNIDSKDLKNISKITDNILVDEISDPVESSSEIIVDNEQLVKVDIGADLTHQIQMKITL